MVFKFPLYICLIPIGIGALVVSYGLYKIRSLTGAIALCLGFAFLGVFGPTLFLDKIELSGKGIYQSSGLWFNQTMRGFDFDGLKRIVIKQEPYQGDRILEVWVAEYESGAPISIGLSDLWKFYSSEIEAQLQRRDIEVERSTVH